MPRVTPRHAALLLSLAGLYAAAPVRSAAQANPQAGGDAYTTESDNIIAQLSDLREQRVQGDARNSQLSAQLRLSGDLAEGERIVRLRILEASAGDVSLTDKGDAPQALVETTEPGGVYQRALQLQASPRSAGVIDALEVAVYLARASEQNGGILTTPPIADCMDEQPLLEDTLAERNLRVRFDQNGREGHAIRLLIRDPNGFLIDADFIDDADRVITPQSIHKHPRGGRDADTALWFIFLPHEVRDGLDLATTHLRLHVADPATIRDVTFRFEDVPLP